MVEKAGLGMSGHATNFPEGVASGPVVGPGKVLERSTPASSSPAPARSGLEREAFDRIVDAARRFVRCADEFGEDYPEACREDLQGLAESLDAYGRVCDAMPDPVPPPILPAYEP